MGKRRDVNRGIRHAMRMREIGYCPVCHGRARLPDGRWCQACGATGRAGVRDE